MNHSRTIIIPILGLFFSLVPIYGQFDVFAQVIRVSDGDTIVVQAGDLEFRVRLHGIDAPEQRQAMGLEARAVLQELLGFESGNDPDRPTVRLMVTDIDRFGRIIARVFEKDQEINLAMLELGFAWHYLDYDQSPEYARAQELAQRTQRGLWALENPIAPWEWRRR